MTRRAWRYGAPSHSFLPRRLMPVGRYEVRTILIPPLVFWTFLMSAGHAQAAILVRGLVDGKPVLLILDTGASSTILARELVRLAPGALASSRFSAEGPGLNANGRYTEATLELGDRRWRNRTVVGMKMDEVSKAYGRR